MQDDISGWTFWHQHFCNIEGLNHPSELNGLMIGVLCVCQAPSEQQWQQILQRLQIKGYSPEALRFLAEESQDVASEIHEDELSYMPVLPDDSHTLQERVQALADWCAGVVLGFSMASGYVRSDEAELIEDLQNVANVQYDPSDDDEDGEQSYQELYEFVHLIPISLATGRKKADVASLPLLNMPLESQNDDTVGIFNP